MRVFVIMRMLLSQQRTLSRTQMCVNYSLINFAASLSPRVSLRRKLNMNCLIVKAKRDTMGMNSRLIFAWVTIKVALEDLPSALARIDAVEGASVQGRDETSVLKCQFSFHPLT